MRPSIRRPAATPLRLALAVAFAALLAACADAPAPATGDDAPTAEDTAAAEAATAAQAAADAGATTGSAPAPLGARVVLAPTEGHAAAGELMLQPVDGGLRVTGTITGLTSGAQHGFHVHETGDCSAPDASSAGGHFNPHGAAHGDRDGGGEHHAGDMPNLVADASGNASVDGLVDGLEVGTGGANDVLGKAVVVHLQADDYASQPAGNAGARIACGVIGPAG